jgi:hypothetical protein
MLQHIGQRTCWGMFAMGVNWIDSVSHSNRDELFMLLVMAII